ncbi:MAG: VCBS repeat-containing protein [Roseiflexaceae bacterium]|nr:VCBS repeat-containing protein [Roseiflexaceae bacterium]
MFTHHKGSQHGDAAINNSANMQNSAAGPAVCDSMRPAATSTCIAANPNGDSPANGNRNPNGASPANGNQHANGDTATDGNEHANGDAPGLSHYHGVGDVNGDGRPDIASAAKIGPDGNWFAWWEKPASGATNVPWKKHIVATGEEGATNIQVADVNGDGRNDFIAARGHGRGIVWYEAPNWTPHQINPNLIGPHSLAIADIDGDGDIDAVTCAKESMIVAWFENDGKGNFTTHHIYEAQSAYDIRLVDMDKDGDLDVLVAGQASENVVWYENKMPRKK